LAFSKLPTSIGERGNKLWAIWYCSRFPQGSVTSFYPTWVG
jgi:hypothetical protein